MAFPKKSQSKTEGKDVKVIVVVPPDGGYSWLIVVASFYSNFMVDGFLYSFSVYLDVFQKHFRFSVIEVTLIGSVFQASYYFSGPVSCAFVNKFGFQFTSFIGTVLMVTGFGITACVNNYVAILCVYGVIAGVGAGFCYTASIIVVNYHFEKYRALATGLATTGSSIGSICLSMGLEHVLSKYGCIQALWVQTVLASSTVLCGLIYRAPKGTDVIIESEAANIYDSTLLLGINDDEREAFLRSLIRGSIGDQNESLHSAIWGTSFHNRYMEMLREEETPRDYTGWKKWSNRFKRKPHQQAQKKIVTTSPFDREDILFRGSVNNLNEHRNTKKEKPIQNHSMLRAFVDPELFKSIPFICLLMCLFTFTMAMATPYMFLVDRAITNKIKRSTAKWILPTISVGSTFGRIVCGVVSFMPRINAAYLTGTTTAIAGLLLIVSALVGTESVACQFALAFSLGFLFAIPTTLRTVCYVRYIGMKLLTSAFGVGLMCAGLAALSGTPIASLLQNTTGNYDWSFVFSGINVLASGGFAFAAEYTFKLS